MTPPEPRQAKNHWAQGDSVKPGVSLGEDAECATSVASHHPDGPHRRTGDGPGRREDTVRRLHGRGWGCRNGRRPARAGCRPETCRGRRRPRGAEPTRRRRRRPSPCGDRNPEVRSVRRYTPSAWVLSSGYVFPVDSHTWVSSQYGNQAQNRKIAKMPILS